jgi:glycosyltransferase involved in cell wall biosynthesis
MHVVHGIAGIARAHGGTSTFVVELANAQARLPGNRVTLITGAPADDELCVSPAVEVVRADGAASFGRAASMIDRRHRIDLIHAHGLWQQGSHDLGVAARTLGTAFVLAPHGMLEPNALRLKRFRKLAAMALFQRRSLVRADALYATADMEADELRRLGFRQPFIVAPPGVELPQPDALRRRPAPGTTTAVFLSRIHPKKNVLGLIDAWARTRPPGWTLVLSGPDADGHSAAVLARIQALGVGDTVRLCGPLYGEDKARLFQEATLFILPSFSENFGIVVAEALSYGVPVIATTGTPWELLEREACGWWVDPSPESLSAALCTAAGRAPDELRAMGGRGRAVAERHFQWPRIAATIQAGYAWLLDGGPVPPAVRLASSA